MISPQTKIKKRITRQVKNKENLELVDQVNTGLTVAASATFLASVASHSVAKVGMGKLLGSVKNLQFLTHVALISVPMVPHAEKFVHNLMEITAFDLVDVSPWV